MRGTTSAMLCTIVFSLSLSLVLDTIERVYQDQDQAQIYGRAPKNTLCEHSAQDACDVSSTTTTTTRLI